MIIKSKQSERKAILSVAHSMAVAARTAPKTRGIDNLEVLIFTDDELIKIADKMKEIGERIDKHFFIRDANCLMNSECAVVLGVKSKYMGLDCGYCGFENCEKAAAAGSICGFNNIDLGIAVGSAVSIATDNRIDNRVMFSIGKAVLELNLFNDDITSALGIPLSSSGKNIFFDRKK